MISIKEEMRTAEKLETLFAKMFECYKAAVEDSGQYVVEVEAGLTSEFRRRVHEVAQKIESAAAHGEDCEVAQTLFRNALRDHRDKARTLVSRLKEDLEETATALQAVMAALSRGSDQERRLDSELERLRTLADCPSLDEMRAGVVEVSAALTFCIESVRKTNQLAVAQLTSEMQLLHKRLEALESRESAAMTQPGIGLRDRLSAEVAAGNACSILLLRIKNLSTIQREHGPDLASRVVECCLKRLASFLGPNATAGAWTEGVLGAVAPPSKHNGIEVTRDAVAQIGGEYTMVHAGEVRRVGVKVACSVLSHSQHGSSDATLFWIEEALKRL